jgi:hypothetical protein
LAAALAVGERWRCALPPDVVLRAILSLLAHDTRAVCAAACVCAAWREVATTTPALWRELRLSWERCHRKETLCIDDDAVACFTRRARGGLTLVDLWAVTRVTDACLVHLSPRAAPLLTELDLTCCSGVTSRGVATALRGARLTSLSVSEIAPVRDDAEDDAALMRELQALMAPGCEVSDDAVCSYRKDGATQRCGELFEENSLTCCWCDVCQKEFCDTKPQRHTVMCDDCNTSVCGDGECLALALRGPSWREPVLGFVCNMRDDDDCCRTMLCGDCVERRRAAPPRKTGKWRQGGHAVCGVCKAGYCDDCAGNGAVCEGAASRAACLRFVCKSCCSLRGGGGKEKVVVCASCSDELILNCSLCVNAGRGSRKESGARARCRKCRS